MSAIVKISELRAADILLYSGTSLIDRLIRIFDGTEYSHSSICDGKNALEAIATGIEQRDVKTSIADIDVDVYRFISADGKKIGDPGCPADPILTRMEYYHQKHDRYAYEALLLLALLTTTRRVAIPGLDAIVREILDQAGAVLARIIAAGKQPMICSELVYRCYAEAGDKYKIRVRGAERAQLAMTQLATGLKITSATPPADGLADEALDFLEQYSLAKGEVLSGDAAIATASITLAVPNFVTPRDLKNSSNLYKVGRLVP